MTKVNRLGGFLSLTREVNQSLRLGRNIFYGVKDIGRDKATITFYMPRKYENYAIQNNPDIEFKRGDNGTLTAEVFMDESVYLSPNIEILVNNFRSSKVKVHTKAPEEMKVIRAEIESEHDAMVRSFSLAQALYVSKYANK